MRKYILPRPPTQSKGALVHLHSRKYCAESVYMAEDASIVSAIHIFLPRQPSARPKSAPAKSAPVSGCPHLISSQPVGFHSASAVGLVSLSSEIPRTHPFFPLTIRYEFEQASHPLPLVGRVSVPRHWVHIGPIAIDSYGQQVFW
jgi:hypothetical protein